MKNMKGLTLIELIVTLAAIAIIIAVGVPRIQNTSQNSRLTAAINTLSADIALARSEAVTRKIQIDINSASGNTDWSQGWEVRTGDAANVLLRTGQALPNNMLLNGAANSFTYNPDGTVTTGAALWFRVCKNGDVTPHGKEIRVAASGRIQFWDQRGCP